MFLFARENLLQTALPVNNLWLKAPPVPQLQYLKNRNNVETLHAGEHWKGGFPEKVFLRPTLHPLDLHWYESMPLDSKVKNLPIDVNEASQ